MIDFNFSTWTFQVLKIQEKKNKRKNKIDQRKKKKETRKMWKEKKKKKKWRIQIFESYVKNTNRQKKVEEKHK